MISFQAQISKKIIKALPSKENPCVWKDYASCVLETFDQKTKEVYNCSLPFLEETNLFGFCDNEVTLRLVKQIKDALTKNQYETCQDIKPCNSVTYKMTSTYNFSYLIPPTTMYFSYKDLMVEEFKDEYVYNFVTIVSEVGGAFSLLVGLSFMLIETLTSLLQPPRKT